MRYEDWKKIDEILKQIAIDCGANYHGYGVFSVICTYMNNNGGKVTIEKKSPIETIVYIKKQLLVRDLQPYKASLTAMAPDQAGTMILSFEIEIET